MSRHPQGQKLQPFTCFNEVGSRYNEDKLVVINIFISGRTRHEN